MTAPFDDIGINPPRSDRRQTEGCVATVGTIKYGMVVIGDDAKANFRDVKLPAGANATHCRGICSDQGDPNNGGAFAAGDEFGACVEGLAEVLLDAGATCTKDLFACTSATPGTVKVDTGTGNLIGQFAQTYDNSAGAAPVLVSIKVKIERAA